MKLALTRRGEYPEPVARELDQLVASITTASTVEHDAEGRQRVTCGKWRIGADQSTTTGVVTRVVVAVPDAANTGSLTLIAGTGIVRVNEPGVYSVLAQVEFAASAAGAIRILGIKRNGTTMAQVDVAQTVYPMWLQATDTIPCVAGDTLEAVVLQDSGGALALSATNQLTFLRVTKVA